MKIGIYINLESYSDIDFTLVHKGNPGLGGSEYHPLILAYFLTEFYEDVHCILYTPSECNLSKERVDNVVINSLLEAVKRAKEDNVDVFLTNKCYCLDLCKLLDDLKLNTVLIGHNFYSLKECDQIAACQYIKRNVFVGQWQYNNYLDLDIIQKSIYIYNFTPFSADKAPRKLPREKIVTYTGSISPAKGFEFLAKAWKSVLKECPDAKLKVIGSGKLYSRSTQLGQYNIAEASYENRFISYLLDNNGKILDSVEFLGIVSFEKYDLYKNTSVGVVNPVGISETFCICAIEFESMGVPVVSRAYGGLTDSIKNRRTGLLYKNPKKLAACIVRLLKDEKLNVEYSQNAYEYVREAFSAEKIIPQWYHLFHEIIQDKPLSPVKSRLTRKILKDIAFIRSGARKLVRGDSIKMPFNNY